MDATLSIADADRVARWFLYRMSMESRRLLMADMPTVYARMFPDVPAHVITDQVTAMIELQRQ